MNYEIEKTMIIERASQRIIEEVENNGKYPIKLIQETLGKIKGKGSYTKLFDALDKASQCMIHRYLTDDGSLEANLLQEGHQIEVVSQVIACRTLKECIGNIAQEIRIREAVPQMETFYSKGIEGILTQDYLPSVNNL